MWPNAAPASWLRATIRLSTSLLKEQREGENPTRQHEKCRCPDQSTQQVLNKYYQGRQHPKTSCLTLSPLLSVCSLCTSHTELRACSRNIPGMPCPRAFARAIPVEHSSPVCSLLHGSLCFQRRQTYLIHRRDLVPFILRGVIHIYLGRVVSVEGRRERVDQREEEVPLGVKD